MPVGESLLRAHGQWPAWDVDRLAAHVAALRACRRCPRVVAPPVAGEPPLTRPRVFLVGQAPGPHEREGNRLFAFTAGTRLFQWFARIGVPEDEFRARVWMAAAIRCFPGRAPQGGDRVPAPDEVATCSDWLERELAFVRPETVIAIGQLAISLFLGKPAPLAERIGASFPVERGGLSFELIPLPHPSGRSTWLIAQENQQRLARALDLLAESPGWRATFGERSERNER
ncbi:MAG TPA: uracil-DNA glycosylase family protein [Thermoanaerobaculia bacterium]|nr:uracil-DNA glycosylase family protein [Thermoanaerobaculia bacterium]